MIEIKLPFWMDGEQLGKLRAAVAAWWDVVETWIKWPVTQMDALTCSIGVLNLLAFQRDVARFTGEPLELFRKRVKFAYINAEDAGSKAGFIRIFERLGIGYVEITERFDSVDWDVIGLGLSDSQISGNTELLNQIIYAYGRTCRRYEFLTITPLTVTSPAWAVGHAYGYDVARI
ncbi:phage tail protein [Methylomonas sp. EFPC1]|uniref:phage tail protein n=1 Tax=Methylomonas sp. EFPC1 TaxID=2812647 RepID=UPI001968058F|nr:phage tail protein [Methylomonas sp. EFPC1]QSB01967.1 phage tail protein [Methylomonas sp. EFPC1]